ncbi:hypothetical protein QJV45_17875 [Listeria booriae]|uniref:hypothetical protein n=1 Tax=Listeria booriae TaxID=1552123 RepID=UPI0028809D8B|nr:hypothetical protein [Listeria booriae]MDT0112337.1 hypothetical protein [Listeria booriae]
MAKKKKHRVISLRTSHSVIYIPVTLLLGLFFLAFLTSRLYLPDDTPLLETPLHEYQQLDNSEYAIESWVYNPRDNRMEVAISISEESDAIAPDITYRVAEKTQVGSNTTNTLKIKEVFKDARNIILRIEDIPKKWTAVSVTLTYKDETLTNNKFDPEAIKRNENSVDESEETATELKLYCDYRTVKTDNSLKDKSANDYSKMVAKRNLDFQKTLLQELAQYMKLEEKKQKQLARDIEVLKEDMTYKVESEKADIQSLIESKLDQIETSKETISEYLQQKKMIQEKEKKLQEQMQQIGDSE